MKTAKIISLNKPFEIKPYSKGELVILYAPISLYVLNKWLKAIEDKTGPIIGRTLNIHQVTVFVEAYGIPRQIVNQAA